MIVADYVSLLTAAGGGAVLIAIVNVWGQRRQSADGRAGEFVSRLLAQLAHLEKRLGEQSQIIAGLQQGNAECEARYLAVMRENGLLAGRLARLEILSGVPPSAE